MIFTILRSRVTGAPKVPWMAPRQPKMVLGRSQDGPRWPQDGPKRALRKLKWAREGPKTEPKWPKWAPRGSPRGLQEGTPTHLGSGTPPGPPRDPSRSPPGPLQGQILEPIGEHFVNFWFHPACPQTNPKWLPAQTRHGRRPSLFSRIAPNCPNLGSGR